MNAIIEQIQANMCNLAKQELDWVKSVYGGFYQSYQHDSNDWTDEIVRSALVINQLLKLVALLEARKV